MKKNNTVILITFLFSGFFSYSQQMRMPTEAKTPSELELILKENFIIQQAIVDEKATHLNYPKRAFLANGVIREMVDVSSTGMPIYIQTTNNLDAAKTIQTNKVWPGGTAGLNLSGLGMTNRLGVWDGGAVRLTHQEFQGRAVQADGATSLADHATHVTGTMCAGGVSTNAKGMSFQAPIKCYDWSSDNSEMSNAASVGLLVSSHSYTQISGWQNSGRWEFWGDPAVSTIEDYKYGFYDNISQTWDQVALTYPYYQIFVAAGNDRGETGQNPYYIRDLSGNWVLGNSSNLPNAVGPYNSISGGPGNAKNVITVGAVNKIIAGWASSADVVMSSFSGWGPTDDGRIKPDIVANGVSVYSCVSTSNTAYSTMNGTSMATPNASGSALLIQQHYNNLKGAYMRASTLKALIIHTADEAGPSAGPDYTFGWGLMNTYKAVQTITDSLHSSIQQNTLSNGIPYSYNMVSDGITPIKVSICWTDRPGTPMSPSLNPTNKMLVNDLDIRVKRNSDNTLFYPYVLNRATPTAAATTGDNSIDNVEKIYIAVPTSGSYTITVTNKGSLVGGPQPYALIVSGISPKPTASFSSISRVVCYNKNIQFYDQSSSGISRIWYFPGGTPASSTATNPLISYSLPGIYPVALRITGASGFDSVWIPDYITVGGIGLPLMETFEPNSTTRSFWTIENPNADTTWRYWNVQGNTPGNTAFGINNYTYPTGNRYDRIVSPVLDLRGYSSAQLQFQHAYMSFDSTADDSLIIGISTNCGNTWTRLKAYGENGLGSFATGTKVSMNTFIPASSTDWCGAATGAVCNTINLTPYLGNANALIRFEQRTNFGGNNLFIDNVNISGNVIAPLANFYTLSKTVCAYEDVQFFDSSRYHPSSWKWYFTDTDTLIYTVQNPNVKFLTPGTKTILLAVKNATGGDSIAKVAYLNVLPSPTVPVITSTKGLALCNGDSTILSTDATVNYSWFKNNTLQNITTNSFQSKEEGNYYVKVSGTNGCSSKSIVLSILAGINPPIPTISKDLTGNGFCEGGSFNLTSSAISNNQWFINSVLAPGKNQPVLNYADSGNFMVRVNDNFCYSQSDVLHIDKYPKPTTSEIMGNRWGIKGDTATFWVIPGLSGSSFNWMITGGAFQTGFSAKEVLVKFNNTSSSSLYVQETASTGCPGVQKTIIINLFASGLVKDRESNKLTIYPNPANHILNVDFEWVQKENIQISLINLLGQEMMRVNWLLVSGVQQKQLEINKLPEGLYILRMVAGTKEINKIFIKE